jgi:hypothetical protein
VTLLEGRQTAYSALKLPLNMQINESSVCNIIKNSAMEKILQVCKLVVFGRMHDGAQEVTGLNVESSS